MKKIIFLLFLSVMFNAPDVFAMHQEDLYKGKVVIDDEGWTIIQSPLKSAGVQLYLRGGVDSEEIVIDVERSLDSTDYSFRKCLNVLYSFVSGLGVDFYGVNYYQLFTMLALAGKTPYGWQTSDVGFMTNAWWINYVNLKSNKISKEICINCFKRNFPKCKRIKLQLYSLRQEIMLEDSDDMGDLLKSLELSNIEFVGLFGDEKLAHEKED